MANAPAGLIVGWPGAAGSVTAGWSRVTALDGKYLRGSTTATGSGGASSHSHSGGSHTHTGPSHTHTPSGSAADGVTGGTQNGYEFPQPETHTHSASSSGSATPSIGTSSYTVSSADNDPSYWLLIFIQSDGTAPVPEGAVAWWADPAGTPPNWSSPGNAQNRLVKGSSTDQGGGTGGSSIHSHSGGSHTHSLGSHNHPDHETGAYEAQTVECGPPTNGPRTPTVSHSHWLRTISTVGAGTTESAAPEISAADSLPPYYGLEAIERGTSSASLPTGLICAWMGTPASIPTGWVICDGTSNTPNLVGKFVYGVGSGGIGDQSGSSTHTHSADSHTHSCPAHSHTLTESLEDSLYSNHAMIPPQTVMMMSMHSHGYTFSNDGAAPTGPASTTLSTSNHTPPYHDVIFVQCVEPPDQGDGPNTGDDCDDGAEDNGEGCEDSGASPCEPSHTEVNGTSARVGPAGEPSGGAPVAGFSGYIGGRPRRRWTGGSVGLEEISKLGISDRSGKATLLHPTTPLKLSFASGQTQPGPLGWNWSHEHNVTLVQQTDSVVDIKHESGRWDRYDLVGSVWTPRAGRRASLIRNGDGTWTETTPYGAQYQFPATGSSYPATVRVSAIVDANASRTTFSYSGGNLQSVLDSFGQRITFSYDGSNRVREVTDASGARTTFGYDGSGNLWSVQHPDGARVTYSYNIAHDPVAIQLPPALGEAAGPVTTLSYDASGRVCNVIDPTGRLVRTISYDPGNRRTVIVDARGGVWTDTYAESGVPQTRQSPLGTSRANDWTEWDATGFVDGRGNRWTYTYDSLHRRTGMISPLLCVHSYEYNADNMPTVYVDPLGNRTTYQYDSQRNRIAEVHADGGVVSYSYYPDAPYGRLRDVQDACGHYTTHTYDARGNLQTTRRPDGSVVTFSYNARNQLESTTDALGHAITSSYDVMGRLTEVQDALGNRTTYVYDLLGRQVAVVDALGNRVTTQYNALGQVEAQVDALGSRVSYSYDANGNRIATVDPLGKVTTFLYDAHDRLIAELDPLGATTSYDYDENGNQRAVVDALGRRTTTSYDAVNRPTAVTDPLNHAVGTVYYTTGWVKATVDQLGNRTTYSYDGMGRQREVLDALGNRTTYSYDLNGNQTEMQDALGNRWTSVYDCMNRLTASIDPSGATTTHSYDLAGRRTATLHAGGGRTSYSYDAANRQIAVSRDEG